MKNFKVRITRILTFFLSLAIVLTFFFDGDPAAIETPTEEGFREYVCNNNFSFESSSGQIFEFSLIKQVPEGLSNPSIESLSNYETIGLYFRKSFSGNTYISWSELSSPTLHISISFVSGMTNFLLGKSQDCQDINSDGNIDILDLIIGKNKFFNNPLNYLFIDGKNINISLFEEILDLKSDISSEFKILNLELKDFVKTPLEQSLSDISFKDLSIPKFDNSDNKYELKDYVFSFKNNEKYYAYTLLSDTQTGVSELISNPVNSLTGLHIWEIEPEEVHDRNVISFTTATKLADTTGRNFEYMSKTYSYNLKKYTEVTRSTILKISSLLEGTSKWYSSSYTYIQYYDYNVDGILTQEDLNILLKNWTSRPDIVFYNYSTYLSRTISGINLKNYVLTLSSIIDPYDFVIPTQEYISNNSLGYVSAFQVIPIEQFYDVTGELLSNSENYDYFLFKKNGQSYIAHTVLLSDLLSAPSILLLKIVENDEQGNKIFKLL